MSISRSLVRRDYRGRRVKRSVEAALRKEGDTTTRLMIILRASRAIIPYLLERCWGLNSDTARRLGSVLSQGVEFAFVLLATDVIQGVISEPIANLLRLAVTLLMAPVRDPRHRRSQKSLPRHPRRHLEAAGRQDRKLTSGCAGFWGARRLLRELTPMLGAIYRRLEFGLNLIRVSSSSSPGMSTHGRFGSADGGPWSLVRQFPTTKGKPRRVRPGFFA